MSTKRDIFITEVALRDGSHAIAHQYTEDHVRRVAQALNDANWLVYAGMAYDLIYNALSG